MSSKHTLFCNLEGRVSDFTASLAAAKDDMGQGRPSLSHRRNAEARPMTTSLLRFAAGTPQSWRRFHKTAVREADYRFGELWLLAAALSQCHDR